MKVIDLLPVLDRDFNENETVRVYMNTDGIKELVMEIYEHKIMFPRGMADRFLNAEIQLVYADKNPERNTIAIDLECDVE